MAKIGRLAESEREGDVVDRHLRVAQILDRHFGPQLIENLPERRSFLAQFPAQRPLGDVEMRGDVLQGQLPSELGDEEAADLSRDPDPMLQPVMQVVAERQHRGVGDFVAEFGVPSSQAASKTSRFAGWPKATGHPKSRLVLRLAVGTART